MVEAVEARVYIFHLHSEALPGVIRIMSPILIAQARRLMPGAQTALTSPNAPAVSVRVGAAVRCGTF